MNSAMKLAIASFAAFTITGCPEPVAPHRDAEAGVTVYQFDPSDECAVMCVHITQLGCPEGARPACYDVCARDRRLDQASQIRRGCIIDAGTVDAAGACGVRCK